MRTVEKQNIELDSSVDLYQETITVYGEDSDGNLLFSIDVNGKTIPQAYAEIGKIVNYREFCEIVQIARWKYSKELKEHNERNADSYASYWRGSRGKSYSHYRREYGA